MSGINRFLSRREKKPKKSQQEKVKSPPMPPFLLAPVSPSTSPSLFPVSSATSTPYPTAFQHSSSSSLSSLGLAFSRVKAKTSPRLQPVGGTVHTSTADTRHCFLLQPRQTEGYLNGLFMDHGDKVPAKSDEKSINAIVKRLHDQGITSFESSDVEYVLSSDFAKGDTEKALDLLTLAEESQNFLVRPYNPNVKLLGAVNRNSVTCYLDATLFAIFSRLESFEGILYNEFEDEPRKRLSTLLRLWVNSLRAGRLITVDITEQLQEALATCGWQEAAEQRQQDASEAFSFITEKLELPMLTLKMDIFHTGKEEANDDHRFVQERLLEVAIPEEPADGKVITLEDCLEIYFNSRIEVKRYLERRATMSSMRSRRSVTSQKSPALHIETVELDESQPSTPLSIRPQSPLPAYSPVRPAAGRDRTPSIIQEHYVSEKAEMGDFLSDEKSDRGRPRAGTLRKEVMMPAWQFFSLIPWYTDTMPNSDAQVAAHFSTKRPILGICLKRYSILPNGSAVRRDTYIDIPLEIALPHFIHDDSMDENGAAFGNFKLSLQSVVCHRGEKIDSGHYVSLVRGRAPSASSEDTARNDSDGDRWILFDDLARERIKYIDIHQALKDESPYLLFYQVQPIDGDPGNIEHGEKPPTYMSLGQDSLIVTPALNHIGTRGTAATDAPTDTQRISFEDPISIQQPSSRTSWASDTKSAERRRSVAFTDESFISPTKATPVSGNASLTVSRRPSRSGKHGSKSRPNSQNGESRLSASFTRAIGKLTKERPEVAVVTADANGTEEDEGGEKEGKLRKEPREKEKGRRSTHLRRGEKPERECVVM